MIIDDGGLGVGGEWEFADLHLMTSFFGFGFCQAHAADLRLTVSAAGNVVLVHRFVRLAGNARDGHNPAHCAYMCKLWHASNDIAYGVNAFFAGLHPFIGM